MEWGEADAPNETVFSLLPQAGLLQTRVKGDGNDFRTLKLSSHSCFVCLFEPSLLFLLLQPELGLQSLTTILQYFGRIQLFLMLITSNSLT